MHNLSCSLPIPSWLSCRVCEEANNRKTLRCEANLWTNGNAACMRPLERWHKGRNCQHMCEWKKKKMCKGALIPALKHNHSFRNLMPVTFAGEPIFFFKILLHKILQRDFNENCGIFDLPHRDIFGITAATVTCFLHLHWRSVKKKSHSEWEGGCWHIIQFKEE